MAKKKNKKSFADLAKEIKNKYTRAHFDPIEARDMEQELNALMEKQEKVRASMGLGDPQQMAGGGKMKYQTGGYPDDRSILPTDFAISSAVDIARRYNPIPSEFATRSAVQLGPSLRGQNLQMPLADLSGVEPGYTEVTVPGDKSRYEANQRIAGRSPSLDNLSNQGMMYGNASRLTSVPFYLDPRSRNTPMSPSYSYDTSPGWSIPEGQSNPNMNMVNNAVSKLRREAQIRKLNNQLPTSNTPNASTANRPNTTMSTPSLNESGVNRNPNERWMANEAGEVAYGINDRIQTRGMSGQSPADINQQEISNLIGNGSQAGSNGAGDQSSFWADNKQYLPYALSGLSNIASNLLLARMAKKNQPRVSPAMATAEEVNPQAQIDALAKRAGVSKNVGMRNARNLGVNAGQALANMGAIGSQVDRGFGEAAGNLRMQADQFNANSQNRVNMFNAQSQGRANMMNAQLGQQNLNTRLGFLNDAAGALPGAMRDIRSDKANEEMRGVMDRYYKSMGNNYQNLGSVWKDDVTGKSFTFKVRGKNPDGTPRMEAVEVKGKNKKKG